MTQVMGDGYKKYPNAIEFGAGMGRFSFSLVEPLQQGMAHRAGAGFCSNPARAVSAGACAALSTRRPRFFLLQRRCRRIRFFSAFTCCTIFRGSSAESCFRLSDPRAPWPFLSIPIRGTPCCWCSPFLIRICALKKKCST